MGFIYTAIISLLWYTLQLVKQTGFVRSYVLASRIKSALAMLLYAKISMLTCYVIKSAQLGKITNLLASDLAVIEMRLATFMSSFAFPVYAIGTTVLLITRLGWPGILGIVFVVLCVPITNCVSRRNGGVIEEINRFKDRRIQTTGEVIEGIKFIKLYGWELAFRRIIQTLRNSEISNQRTLSLGRSLERSIGNFVGIASGLIMYVASHYSNTGLSTAKIFSCLEVVFSFKYSIFMLTLALGFYYEVVVVFTRFASVFNINNTAMVELHPHSKKPIHSKDGGNKEGKEGREGSVATLSGDIGLSLQEGKSLSL